MLSSTKQTITPEEIRDLAWMLENRAMDFEEIGLTAWARECQRLADRLPKVADLIEQEQAARET